MKAYQEKTADWLRQCFPPEAATDNEERCDRFLEEALELVQSCGHRPERAHRLVDYVYGRQIGETGQELGGVMVTLAALSNAFGLDIEAEASRELERVCEPATMERIRAKQAAKPKGSALPVAFVEDTLPEPDRLALGLLRLLEGRSRSHIMEALMKVTAAVIYQSSKNATRALGEVSGHFADMEDRVKAYYSGLREQPFAAPVPISGEVRPEVAAFALRMEARLRENDHKPGWKNEHPQWLTDQSTRHAAKLALAMDRLLNDGVRNLDANRNAVPTAAADLANFAMMVADVVTAGGLAGKAEGEAA
ncbi:hypothetical protein [Aureimonas ureilytica]|uniref:hypothetical protein n=1 Tax=Aureimonas ureilytica TaxID=401562 RepID=UPI000364DEEA|nr:hypothetical protein [Aureimonas ureilytica]